MGQAQGSPLNILPTGATSGAASGLSMASLGLGAIGTYMQAEGTATADTFKAEQLEQQTTYGELKAVQTGGHMTRNLNVTLGNIDAIRAAAKTDITSPTGAAVRDYTQEIGTEQKNIVTSNIEEQARMDEANAAYLRTASSNALLAGGIGAGAGIIGAIGKGLPAIAGA